MAKVTAPLLGFGARGSIGKTQVYGSWKGISYARKHTIPSNPRSTGQTQTRSIFAFLSNTWKTMPADMRTAYSKSVKGRPLTDRNAFMGNNTRILRPLSSLVGMQLSPGAVGGLPADAVVTGGSGSITIDGTAPAVLPAGWSIVRWIGAAMHEQDPHVGTNYAVHVGDDSTSPYAVVLSGLPAGDYVASGWFEYQRSSLATDLAYGPAIAVAVTVS